MPKANLVTRTATSSSVTDTNLNKGSALTHAEMDSNLINLRDASFGIRDDSSTVLQVTKDKTIHIAGGTNCTSALSGDTITINATGDVTGSSTTTFTNKTFDADATGNNLTNIEVANLKSGVLDTDLSSVSGSDDTLASAKAIKAYVDANSGGGGSSLGDLTAVGSTLSSPSNADLTIQTSGSGNVVVENLSVNGDGAVVTGIKDEDNMSSNSNTKLATQQSIKAYVDDEDANIASDTLTFTNKTIDANGTGNNISNIDIGNMTAAVVVLESEGIGSNDNDTTLPTSAAVKDYADSKATLSGSTDNTIATVTGAHALQGESNLTFDGSTLAVTGAATVSTTLGVTGDATLDGIIIHDNSIKTANSNANLEIGTQGTGKIELTTDDSSIFESTKYSDFFGSTDNIRGVVINTNQEVNANTTGRNYMNVINQDTKLVTASSSSNSNFRQRTMLVTNTTDMNGFSYTRSGFSRGPTALTFGATVMNTGGSASTIKTVRGFDSQAGIYVSTASNLASDATITDCFGANSTIYATDDSGSASGNATVTNGTSYRASYYLTSGHTFTNHYGYRYIGAEDSAATNRYAFYSEDAAASSRMGAIRLDNQSGDPTHGDGFGWIYAKDDSGSSEVHVKDEAGNVTKISPHNDAGEWEYYSKNSITGKTVRINMEKLVAEVEKLSGKKFIENK